MNTPDSEKNSLNFDQLVNTYYTPLYRFGYSLAGNDSDACDLAQQTFYIWAKKGSSLREASKVKSWLFTTLYREFLRIRRRNANTVLAEPEVIESEAPIVTTDIVAGIDSALAVECLNEIDEIYRTPLTLFYLQDLSYKEIASALELPIGTVMSRLSRGKTQLKNILVKKDSNKALAEPPVE